MVHLCNDGVGVGVGAGGGGWGVGDNTIITRRGDNTGPTAG